MYILYSLIKTAVNNLDFYSSYQFRKYISLFHNYIRYLITNLRIKVLYWVDIECSLLNWELLPSAKRRSQPCTEITGRDVNAIVGEMD